MAGSGWLLGETPKLLFLFWMCLLAFNGFLEKRVGYWVCCEESWVCFEVWDRSNISLRCCFCHSSLSTSSQASTDDDELMMMITQQAPLAHDSTSGAG